MKSRHKFGVMLLLLVSCVAPAVACMTPDARMTTEERACCRTMKNQCGQMEMPGAQDCCKKTPGSIHESALKPDAVSFHPDVFTALRVSSFELLSSQDASDGWVQLALHSPPKSPPSAITNLRI